MKDVMAKVGDHMQSVFNPDRVNNFGWMVLVFPIEEGTKTASYISNCTREDMINALREKADVLERKLDHPPIETN